MHDRKTHPFQHRADGGATGILPKSLAAKVADSNDCCCVTHIGFSCF